MNKGMHKLTFALLAGAQLQEPVTGSVLSLQYRRVKC